MICLSLFLALALCGAWQTFAWGRTQLDTGALVCADTLRLHIRPENDSIASQSAKHRLPGTEQAGSDCLGGAASI